MILFDFFLIISFLILLSAGLPFLSPSFLETIRSGSKIHRLALESLTFLNIAFFAYIHIRGKLKQSKVVSSLIQLPVRPIIWVWFFFIALGMVTATSSIIRHYTFSSSFDFAIFVQAIWNTLHGHFLYSSIKGGICLLGDHVSPFLILFAPFFLIWDSPSLLLIMQAFAAASSVIPIFLIGKEVLKEEGLALIPAIGFILYLPIRNAIRFDFHPELFGDPLILWAFYFILKKRFILVSTLLLICISTKETACVPVAMLGLYTAFVQKKRLFGLMWFFVSIIIFLVEVRLIAPFYGGDYFYLAGNYLNWLNEPGAFLKHLSHLSTLTYLKKIFLPVGFFSFLNLSSLILTFPILFQNLAAKNILARSIFFQYTTFLTPFVFISAIYGFAKYLKWVGNQKNLKIAGIYWFIGWALLMSGVSEVYVISKYFQKNDSHWNEVRQYLSQIPSHYSVRANEFFAPHLAKRKELYIYENQHPREGGSLKAQNADYVILDRRFVGESYLNHLEELQQKNYTIKLQNDGFYILKKKNIL